MKNLLIGLAVCGLFFLYVQYAFHTESSECESREAEVRQAIEPLAACTEDSDCTFIKLQCPFDCQTPVAKENVEKVMVLVGEYYSSCLMSCPECDPVRAITLRCENGRCVM